MIVKGFHCSEYKFAQLSIVFATLFSDASSGCSGVRVEFDQLSFLVKSMRESNHEFLDRTTEFLHSRVVQQELKELSQLQTCFNTLQRLVTSRLFVQSAFARVQIVPGATLLQVDYP